MSGDNTESTNIVAIRANNLTQGVALGWNSIREIGTNGNNPFKIDAQGAGNLLLQTNSTGNVGIGTTTPSEILDITNSSTSPFLAINNNTVG